MLNRAHLIFISFSKILPVKTFDLFLTFWDCGSSSFVMIIVKTAIVTHYTGAGPAYFTFDIHFKNQHAALRYHCMHSKHDRSWAAPRIMTEGPLNGLQGLVVSCYTLMTPAGWLEQQQCFLAVAACFFNLATIMQHKQFCIICVFQIWELVLIKAKWWVLVRYGCSGDFLWLLEAGLKLSQDTD